LPNFSNDTKMPLDFASRRLGDIFEYASAGHFGETRSYLPLAAAGKENRMVAVDLSKPELPVVFFDYEDGFHSHAPTFDACLRGLLAKGELTPLERLAAACKEAQKLNEKNDYAAVEAKLGPLLSLVPDRQPDSFDDFASVPGRVLNLLGLAREHQGDVAGA